MKAVPSVFAALFFLFCAVPSPAAPYPSPGQLWQAIDEISARLMAEKMDVEVLDAIRDGVQLPLIAAGLRLGDGTCIVYVNEVVEVRMEKFFRMVPAQDMPIWLNPLALHEIAHSIEQRGAYIRRRFNLVLPPGMPRENITVQGYLAVVKSGSVETWAEALADIVSVLDFKEAVS